MDAETAQHYMEEVRKFIEAGAPGADEDQLDYIMGDAGAIETQASNLLDDRQIEKELEDE